MTTSPAVPTTPVTDSTDRTRDSSRRSRKKKTLIQSDDIEKYRSIRDWLADDNQTTEWKSEQQQQVYRSKLLRALRRLESPGRSGSGAGTRTGATVRETADRVLAVTAKGRTRWSRAILMNKFKLKLLNNSRRQRGLVVTPTGNSRLKKPKVHILKLKKLKMKKLVVVKKSNLLDVQRRARVLGGLVPGCEKQSLPVVLKEATDYIPALEMQVKAMAALVELLSGGSGSGLIAGDGNLGPLSLSRPPPG
ncbi:putative helix-loop-helix DNA-binding domain superfamily [Helianthus annuus]|uniref:Helix-loop-helix DNA-binding domain superfamily n=1 Tax=Helianthus annuus TaxID=4232 RepID=A0A251VHD0_HELAN|nr:transcription factor bHLH148 [Helianthus annuus]KAF5819145.1 putative helix-loop-helix DNA-binding domain superfamily [Helianthus annuus]KAJ0605348.1 putative helix-loop-helix DNA-binding domain superfamily, transcription factor IBH1 [Helianthus annuus]KAJ0619364.1 putative helix-loop-helix DNA-binding domain superfamily, transcription factor IBH1 [Helianthus annuus]